MIINLPLINDYIKVIQALAKSGRNDYQVYLVRPIASWSKNITEMSLEELLKKIDLGVSFLSAGEIASLYKKALLKSTAQDQLDLSIPGNLALKFLKAMKHNTDIAYSDEAAQFVALLKKPFTDYNQSEYQLANKIFARELNTAEDSEVKSLLKVSEKNHAAALELKNKASQNIKDIGQIVAKLTSADAKRKFIEHLLKFSSSAIPDLHKELFPLLTGMEKVFPGFKKDVLDTTAVLIYHEIIKAVRSQSVKRAIQFISKYTVLFRGNPDTPNYYEVDSFERVFFELIEKRGLWDSF